MQGYEYGTAVESQQDRPRTGSKNRENAGTQPATGKTTAAHEVEGATKNIRTTTSPPGGTQEELLDSSSGTPKVQINQQTKDKAASVKAYIENKYAKAKYEERERKEAWDKLN